ncbi:putative type IX sorting system protein PorV2 [Brumimicrobium salinarum]|uniref:putative type IX sorting system protein PorV2 n=1 Tax=Brumimicrobium salinarum TaxID=2058658 RepID=UPI0010550E70|nr:PorV/PorQ family protein [Brumimicrobium salinarum]
MKRSYLFLLLFLLILSEHVLAQDETIAPKYSNEFLQIGVGARALGMGNSIVAGVNDVTSVYWNPAGLTGVNKKLDVGLMHSEYFAGIAKYDYLGLAHSIDDKSSIGFAAIRFGVDNIPNTTQLIDNEGNIDYDRITTFTAADYGFLFSYGRKLGVEGLSVGGTVKVIHRRAGEFARSWGFGLDAGLQYKINDKWYFGAMARDITSTFNAWIFNLDTDMQEVFLETGNEIPENGLELTMPRLILAAKRKFDIGWQDITISPEINAVITTDGKRNTLIKSGLVSIDPMAGLEIGWRNIVAIRTGINNFQYVKNFDDSQSLVFQPNVGLGVTFKGITLDYAFTNIGNQSEALFSHVVSLKFGFK